MIAEETWARLRQLAADLAAVERVRDAKDLVDALTREDVVAVCDAMLSDLARRLAELRKEIG